MSCNRTIIDDELYAYLLAHSRPMSQAMAGLKLDSEQHLYDRNMRSAPESAALLVFLAKMINARRIIEVGVFSGFVTLALAEALPEAAIIALDSNQEFVDIGIKHWVNAGVRDRIDLRIAPALNSLDALLQDPAYKNSIDFIFIDADKGNYPEYYARALELVRPGGIIVLDNTLFHGTVIDPKAPGDAVRGIRKINTIVQQDDRVDMTMLPVADGITLLRKK